MSDRRLYEVSEMPMTEAELKLFREAYDKHYKKTLRKNPNPERAHRLSVSAGEAAVRRSRGPKLSAEERTLPLRFA